MSIDHTILMQAQSYAGAVADDPRFRDTTARWVFWLVANKMTIGARKQVSQGDRARGLFYKSETGHIQVWVKTWGELIDANRARMHFSQQRLQYKVDDQSALDALRKLHSKYSPPVFAEPASGAESEHAAEDEIGDDSDSTST